MINFYDLQQFLKSFGIIIYMKDRKHTLSMVEYEVRELRRLELISKEINIAVEIGCISEEAGRIILADLEDKASEMYASVISESKAN